MESKVPIEGKLKTLAGHCSCKILKSFASELATIRQPPGCWDLYNSTGLENISYLPHIYHLSKTQHSRKYINWSNCTYTCCYELIGNGSTSQQRAGNIQESFKYAYKQGCSTEDIINMNFDLNKTLTNPNNRQSSFLGLQVLFSPNLIQLLFHKENTLFSSTWTNAVAPQGNISSLVLFTLFTKDCNTRLPIQFTLLSADWQGWLCTVPMQCGVVLACVLYAQYVCNPCNSVARLISDFSFISNWQ